MTPPAAARKAQIHIARPNPPLNEPTPPTVRGVAHDLIRDVVKLRDQLLLRLNTAAVVAIGQETNSKPTQHQTL